MFGEWYQKTNKTEDTNKFGCTAVATIHATFFRKTMLIPYYVYGKRRCIEIAASLIRTDSSNMKIEAIFSTETPTKIYHTIYRLDPVYTDSVSAVSVICGLSLSEKEKGEN
jgi:hypothetical protein